MRGSVRIATLFKIPVFVHWSFGLLLFFVIYVGKSRDASWGNIALFGAFVLMLFVCVLLHEFGHALSARFYGVQTRDITILPIGGVARLDHLPERPFQEFVVAIAGPMVNVAIFGLLSVVMYFAFSLSFSFHELLTNHTDEIINPTVGFIATLMQANLMLVIFNMIPAFPMDGGRVLRALLSMQLGRARATQVAATLGQIIAIGFLIYAFLPAIVHFLPKTENFRAVHSLISWAFQPVLMLISFFVFFTARAENRQVRREQAMLSTKIKDVMRTNFTRLRTSDNIFSATIIVKKGIETSFLVFDDAEILRGLLQENDLADAVENRQFDALISTYSTICFENNVPNADLKSAYDQMLQAQQSILPVIENGVVVGVLDWSAVTNVEAK